jgi:hypothetical protein
MQTLAGGAGMRHAPQSAAALRSAYSNRRPTGAQCMRIMHQASTAPGPLRRVSPIRRMAIWQNAGSHSI